METTNISQRVAAISGAASGIGLALATLYARRGIRVIAGYYPDDPHDPTVAAAQVEEAGGDALWLPLNVADTASVDTFIAQGVAHYGRLDYVIANAGILRCASIEEMNDDRWNEMLNVDLTGVMRCFRAATPRLISGGVWSQSHRLPGASMAGRSTPTTRRRKPQSCGFVAHWPLSLHREVFAATP